MKNMEQLDDYNSPLSMLKFMVISVVVAALSIGLFVYCNAPAFQSAPASTHSTQVAPPPEPIPCAKRTCKVENHGPVLMRAGKWGEPVACICMEVPVEGSQL